MNLFFEILIEFGLPVAASGVMGVFIYMILKYILESVVGQVGSIHGTLNLIILFKYINNSKKLLILSL